MPNLTLADSEASVDCIKKEAHKEAWKVKPFLKVGPKRREKGGSQ